MRRTVHEGEGHANGFREARDGPIPPTGCRRVPVSRRREPGLGPGSAAVLRSPAPGRAACRLTDPGGTAEPVAGVSRRRLPDRRADGRRRHSGHDGPAGAWWLIRPVATAISRLLPAGDRRAAVFRLRPPGYQPADPQGGLGAPLYRPIPIPSPDQIPTDLEREKFVTRGLFPGTYLVPGTNTSFKWYGFVRLDGNYDLNPIGGTDSFVTAQIPVPQGRGQNFAANPRYSRLGMDTWTPTPLFDWNVHTRIEMDFFNGNNSGVFGSYPVASALRLCGLRAVPPRPGGVHVHGLRRVPQRARLPGPQRHGADAAGDRPGDHARVRIGCTSPSRPSSRTRTSRGSRMASTWSTRAAGSSPRRGAAERPGRAGLHRQRSLRLGLRSRAGVRDPAQVDLPAGGRQ